MDSDEIVGDLDLAPSESCDVLDLLAEEEDENGRRAVTRRELVGMDNPLVWTTRWTASS